MVRLIQVSTTVKQLNHRVYLSGECQEDIYMWEKLLDEWTGISMFRDEHYVSSVELTLFMFACFLIRISFFLQTVIYVTTGLTFTSIK